jgi:hypothetical protein
MHQPTDGAQQPPELFQTPGGPATLVFCDEPDRRGALAAMARGLGGLVVHADAVERAAGALRRHPGSAVAVIDLASDGGASLDELLHDLDQAVADARVSALVIAQRALIDIVTARISRPEVRLVVGFDEAEVTAALAKLLGPRGLVAEPGAEENARRLAELSDEAARISRALASLSSDAAGLVAEAEAVAPAAPVVADRIAALATTRALIRMRRLREQFFERTLFADPAWDMLLDLFAARLEGRQVAVSSLCIAAAVPPTTALRWIAAMTEQGLLLREPDPDDRRRIFIALSAAAEQAMAGFLTAATRVLTPAQPERVAG